MLDQAEVTFVDWRMLLVEAGEIEHFRRVDPQLSARSILGALSLHGLDRKAVQAELVTRAVGAS